jgi:hypothetical protein
MSSTNDQASIPEGDLTNTTSDQPLIQPQGAHTSIGCGARGARTSHSKI